MGRRWVAALLPWALLPALSPAFASASSLLTHGAAAENEAERRASARRADTAAPPAAPEPAPEPAPETAPEPLAAPLGTAVGGVGGGGGGCPDEDGFGALRTVRLSFATADPVTGRQEIHRLEAAAGPRGAFAVDGDAFEALASAGEGAALDKGEGGEATAAAAAAWLPMARATLSRFGIGAAPEAHALARQLAGIAAARTSALRQRCDAEHMVHGGLGLLAYEDARSLFGDPCCAPVAADLAAYYFGGGGGGSRGKTSNGETEGEEQEEKKDEEVELRRRCQAPQTGWVTTVVAPR